MQRTSSYRLQSPISKPVFDRIRHLNLTDRVTQRDAVASGHGGLSEIFKGRCELDNGTDVCGAIKRLRYHLADLDMGKVRKLRRLR